MKVFRLARLKYAKSLSGKGAAKSGNHWNSKGVEMIYTAESRALAMAEVLVHISLNQMPSDYKMLTIKIPDDIKIKNLKALELPISWNSHPPSIYSQQVGDAFIMANDFCVLKVPSVVVYGNFNYLINPYHKDFNRIKIKIVDDFPIDQRLRS